MDTNLKIVEELTNNFKPFLKEGVYPFFSPKVIKMGDKFVVGCTFFIDGKLDKEDIASNEFFIPVTIN